MVDHTALANENSALREQLEKANQSIKHYEAVEKTNLELVQKISTFENLVSFFISHTLCMKNSKINRVISCQKESQKIQALWNRK